MQHIGATLEFKIESFQDWALFGAQLKSWIPLLKVKGTGNLAQEHLQYLK